MESQITTPSLRRPSLAIGVAIGLLAGSMLTALLTAGDDDSGSNIASTAPSEVVSGDVVTPAAGEAASTTAPVATAPASPAAGASPSGSATSPPPAGSGSSGRAATGAAAPALSACAGAATAGVRGLTDTTIKLGVGLPDLRALEPLLGEKGKLGDQAAHFRAHLAALRKKGVLPICGRDIVPVFRSYNILDQSQSRAVCQGFVNDDKVFAVVTQFAFGDPNCVTQENKTFLLDHGLSLSQDVHFSVAGGRLYSLHPPVEVDYRIWATWASKRVLTGKKVGVYYNNYSANSDRIVGQNLIEVLKQHGHEPTVVTSNTNPTVGAQADPNDSVAVQRFKAAGVQVVFLVATGFQDEAQRQNYKPLYVRYGANAKDSSTGGVDPEHFDGSLGIHWDQVNEVALGAPPSARAEECIRESEAAGIKRPRREWAEWNGSMLSCDLISVFLGGVAAAGRNLTTDRLALGVQTLKNVQTALVSPVSYSATKHWGIGQNREARYYKECTCWKNTGPWQPLYL